MFQEFNCPAEKSTPRSAGSKWLAPHRSESLNRFDGAPVAATAETNPVKLYLILILAGFGAIGLVAWVSAQILLLFG